MNIKKYFFGQKVPLPIDHSVKQSSVKQAFLKIVLGKTGLRANALNGFRSKGFGQSGSAKGVL